MTKAKVVRLADTDVVKFGSYAIHQGRLGTDPRGYRVAE